MAKTKKAEKAAEPAPETREPVGQVKVVVSDPELGKVVKRIPLFEGDDPAKVLAEAQANSGRNVPEVEQEQYQTPPELETVRPEKE